MSGGAGHGERRVGVAGPETSFEWAAEPALVLDQSDDRAQIDRLPALGEPGAGSAGGGADDGEEVGSGLQRVARCADPVDGMLGDERGERA